MNPDLEKLQPYPFEKLNSLKTGVRPPAGKPHIALSIGEPKHQPPAFVVEEVITHLHGLANYPITKGRPELRAAAGAWLTRRFGLPTDSIDPEANLLPVAGTREALFAFAQAVVDRSRDPLVLAPNPFYQIYEGAALLAGATPFFLNTTAENRFLPDLDAVTADVWQRTQLIYLCSPGNPTGAVMPVEQLQRLIRLADEHDFIIASDECYSELYFEEDTPPPGLLQAAAAMGRDDYRRCVVFHSLSKRSNLPGLRSGFVAGDRELLRRFLHYRTYQGCALPPPTQAASIVAWQDETHVKANRDLYRAKFGAVLDILQPVLDIERPDAGFYLWPKTPIADTDFTRGLFKQQNVTVLPGSYLSREAHGLNPGAGRIRMALVAELDECIEAAERVRRFVESL
ncbi:succinyldiaminopimelate transaminase [Thiohalomonas denitrificans]|uniref:Succinyldiaminopimelate aminotransferase apoenzyme n=1 Tax=Thiohalomonas denitrificans TaxID=415747 RepID=A0A1G5Q2C1_9GAMM|nr:succinyldiaminopimelate transaminase [Thiohalomonas denitrificans]SCZ55768.1 succinyldiaminopimelate aminotransferase apoenzyme [Thiohalomonas denitrificans]